MHGFEQFIIIYINLKFNLIWININIMDNEKRYMLICFFIFILTNGGKEQDNYKNEKRKLLGKLIRKKG